MSKFTMRRRYGLHITFAMAFILVLLALLSIYHWEYGVVGLLIFAFFSFSLYHAEKKYQSEFKQYVRTLSGRVKKASRAAVDRMPVGILLYDTKQKIEWHNAFVYRMVNKESLVGARLDEVFPQLLQQKGSHPFRIQIDDHTFEVTHHLEERLFYFRDVTQLAKLEKKYEQEQPVVGFLHLDNFDEAGQELDDQQQVLLLTDIMAVITRWAQEYDISFRRFESDKVFLIMRLHSLEKIIQNRFDILDKIRDLTNKNKIPVTFSIGLAYPMKTLAAQTQNALNALNMSLARGGDQAAIHDGERVTFFGGKTNAVERRTRVRARVISHALTNLIASSDRVLIMGHINPDMDALGSAIGILKAVQISEKDGYVVLDKIDSSIERLVTAISNHPTLGDRLITPEEALHLAGQNTLLIIVDTHKPSMVIEPRLIDRCDRVVVIDHHRRGEEFIPDPVLVYLEPYASSTSELVTELLQYQKERISLDPLEATALFTGICVDTKRFSLRAGSRTFEAAAFLRNQGADLALVESLLEVDFSQLVKRAEIVKNAEVIYDKVALAVGESDSIYDQLIIAQAADHLLDLKGIVASFVIGMRDDGRIGISARSRGELNVQVVMEELGGGGHLTHAAAQLTDTTLHEAAQMVKDALQKQINNNP